MIYRGIVYDVGLRFTPDNPYSVEHFDAELVAHDVQTIATHMHANTIRIEGEEIDRLLVASRMAHAAGLTVFFNPWKMNVPVADLPAYFAQAALAAEQLRNEGVDLIFVAGCEMSLFNEGILDGSSIAQRVQGIIALSTAKQAGDNDVELARMERLNNALAQIVARVRETFTGRVTYSAGMWETVDWSLFDMVGIDHYRSNESAEEYTKALDPYRLNKPLVVMEVGSCAYEGAGKLGAGGFMRLEGVNPDGTGIFTDGIVPTRSEREQANYVEEQLQLLTNAGIDGVFIYVFSFPTFPYAEGARDFDMMSFSLVKTYPAAHPNAGKMPPWEPKQAFFSVASRYKALAEK
ncbi:hypothetical protein [Dickeya undicola]|uniref:Abortive infection protein n=1 Tax=Dickeya undicola TaxID=1577887 RepID=A0A3N0FV71_9GAMM|nr:hypothetical protein [Dickeya undicola]RNM03840.1 hypothetical protein EF878_17410 [Dickeya undicola]